MEFIVNQVVFFSLFAGVGISIDAVDEWHLTICVHQNMV